MAKTKTIAKADTTAGFKDTLLTLIDGMMNECTDEAKKSKLASVRAKIEIELKDF